MSDSIFASKIKKKSIKCLAAFVLLAEEAVWARSAAEHWGFFPPLLALIRLAFEVTLSNKKRGSTSHREFMYQLGTTTHKLEST